MESSAIKEAEERLELTGLSAAVGASCAAGPEPPAALQRAGEVLCAAAEADPSRLTSAWQRNGAGLVRALTIPGGVAPFLVRYLVRYPGWLFALAEDDLSAARSAADYETGLAGALAGVGPEEEDDALRRYKYLELARITLRDGSVDLVPQEAVGETLAELSHLADALLSRALELAAVSLATRLGPPRWKGAAGEEVSPRFCVLGLGKLGSEELNYSSDVDLVYVFEAEPVSAGVRGGPSDLGPEEYLTRLAHQFGRRVASPTPEGFLYRVDLGLRPEGARGPLVVPSDWLATYCDGWAATWEHAAWMKARPVAGDLRFGWDVIRSLAPMLYRSAMDYAGVEGIKLMKKRIEREVERRGGDFDVKLGQGGIRDVEFVVQALQLLHGGRIPQVRGRSTQKALTSLAECGVLKREQAEGLLASYRFLRRVENRLQMREERQTHRVPGQEEARERLARSLGFAGPDAVATFDGELEGRRERVREIFDLFLSEHASDRVLQLFARGAAPLLAIPSTRKMVEDLAQRFAREIDTAADPELALNNLDRFIQGMGTRTFYYGLLLDRPELVSRLAGLFGASRYLSMFFARHPDLIEPVFVDPDTLLPSKSALRDHAAQIQSQLAEHGRLDAAAIELAALRFFYHRAVVNVALLDLDAKIERREAEEALTEIAEICLERALALAQEQVRASHASPLPVVQSPDFLVVGMGKLGSRELSYGSDLDVIFLYDVDAGNDAALLEAQVHSVRLAQRLIGALQTRTAEGNCYEVDARLRPSGRQGTLVTSLASFRSYHETSAVWELQSLLRARPVAGSPTLADRFEEVRLQILRRPPRADIAAEIHHARSRIESERAQERRGRYDLKTGRGGLLDVEDAVQYLQLRNGVAYPQLFETQSIETQLGRIETLELIGAEPATRLREGWEFLQRLSSRLRIVENRSISNLDEDRGDIDSVTRALGYSESQWTGSSRRQLVEDYRRHTDAIRAVYLETLGV